MRILIWDNGSDNEWSELLEFKKIFIASCSIAVLCPENISSLESRNKSPEFRLIKRTSRAIYNLQSFVCFVLIYMNDVFLFGFAFVGALVFYTQTAHRINKVFFLLPLARANFFYAYEIGHFLKFTNFWNNIETKLNQLKIRRQTKCQIKRKSTWNRLNIRIQINEYIHLAH